MDFTGERYIPSQQGQIKYEHLHRYAMSLSFVEGKSVLDVASGEGYGAAVMASIAQSVIGVDIDLASVKHARHSYYEPKLRFFVGSCDAIPFADASFDVVTSFETIEHHDKHEEMVREIKRVLKSQGLLIISSPNRLTYSDEPAYVNPFHVKELYFDEFHSLLSRHFKFVSIYGQRLATGSFMTPLADSKRSTFEALTGDVNRLDHKVCALPAPIYFVALCSDTPESLPGEIASVYFDPANDLFKEAATESVTAIRQMQTQVRGLQEQIEKTQSGYEEELRRRSNELILAATKFRAMQRRYEATQHHHEHLIADLRGDVQQHKSWLVERTSQIKAHAEALQSLQDHRLTNARWQSLEKKLRRAPAEPRFEGVLDYPKAEVPVTDRIEIYGWVYSPSTTVLTIQAFLDDIYLGIVAYGHERPDVAAAFPAQAPLRCGYKGQFWINHLGLAGQLSLRIIVTDGNGNRQLYTRQITIAESSSTTIEGFAAAIPSKNGRDQHSQIKPAAPPSNDTRSRLDEVIAKVQSRVDRIPSVLDWNSGMTIAAARSDLPVCSPPPGAATALPYLDRSIDIVVHRCGAPECTFEARRVAAAAVILVGENSLDVEWIEISAARRALPTTSIIIPAYNNASYTQRCLERVIQTLPFDFDGEIIVVDDASSDDTPQLLARWTELDPRVKVLRNSANMGFIRSCNRGAEAAHGEILVFLNNDTLPQPEWLPPLLRIFNEHPTAGAVGGKLIYPDGTLQEAGGVIFSDGSGCNLGKHDKAADAPLYNFVREVDYCSGALLATRRDLFMGLAGFDVLYEPAYYEDADYCFSLRAKGYRVYYQPESVVVHFEGASCGTDINTGVKSYQTINRLKFVEKWREALQRQPGPPEQYDFATLQALCSRGAAWGDRPAVGRPRSGVPIELAGGPDANKMGK